MRQDSSACRCFICPTYVDLPSDDHVLRRWASYDELDRSAEAGCDVCALCRQALAQASSIERLRLLPGEVRLHGGKTYWTLKYPTSSGGYERVGLRPEPESENTGGRRGFNLVQTYRDRRNRPPALRRDLDMFGQAADWLQNCLSHHSDCQRIATSSQEPAELPKRLIDLSHGDDLRVFNCQDRVESGAIWPGGFSYCTLSYRWGDTPHSCVLRAPFEDSLLVRVHSMPQTFQDAVKVVRRLGIRYLWIDALCIVQPSSGDDTEWIEEGSRMGIIYQNAACSIAATSGLHANQGFLNKTGVNCFPAEPVLVDQKDSETGQWQTYKIPVRKPDFYKHVSHSALNNRGWVVQERALSTRIIHFTVHGLFWECGCMKAHDMYGVLQSHDDFPSCRSKETLLSVARTQRSRHVCPVEWFHFVKQYSYTEFTNPQDRLLALSSVAKAVRPYLGGHDYIAGLWKDDIVRGLAWKCYQPRPRKPDPATPSWSWAAARGGIDLEVFAITLYSYNLVEVVAIAATPVSAANPFGSLSRGSITLKGRLAFEWLPRTTSRKYNRKLDVYWDDAYDLEEAEQQRTIDQSSKAEVKRYPVLPIARDSPPLEYRTYLGALILEPTGTAEVRQTDSGEILRSEFRRIGWVIYSYAPENFQDKRRYWVEREMEEIVLI